VLNVRRPPREDGCPQARAEKAEALLHRQREEDRAVEEFLAQESEGLASGAEYKPRGEDR
jgi:hypothetical protein